MNNKLNIILYLFIVFISTVSRAEFITTYSINSKTVEDIEKWIDKDTIILVEIDDVLVLPESKMFSFDSNPYRMFINNLITLGKKSPMYNKAVANWYAQRKIKLVEEGWLDFFDRARQKGAKIYGICSMPLNLTNIEAKRFRELSDLGVVFDSTINNNEEMVIKRKAPWFSRFNKGIIYTGPYPKSKTILELLKITNLSPEKILTFGNVKHEVKSIDKSLRRFNMYFKSVLYLGSRSIKGKPDYDVVKIQQRELIEKGKWHEDDEAAKLIDFRRQRSSLKQT